MIIENLWLWGHRIVALFLIFLFPVLAQPPCKAHEFTIARLKYDGGGDWYNDPSATSNMLKELKIRTQIPCREQETVISLTDPSLFEYPFLFATGHGNIAFSPRERIILRKYLENGGFLFVDDDYGMDPHIRREIKELFPDNPLVPIPRSHKIFNIFYEFPQGIPKIHEHDGEPPQALGIFIDGRLVLLYAYETNISDGWPGPEIHPNPPEIREEAFRFGVNILVYSILKWGFLDIQKGDN